MSEQVLTLEGIKAARKRIEKSIVKTPVLTSSSINELIAADLYFKCENFQIGGSFKVRGASNAVACLTDEERARGVAAHSAGNHAQGVALAARKWGIPAHIVMPKEAVKVKIEAVKSYDAKLTFSGKKLSDREKVLKKVIKETGAVEIHPYNKMEIMEGQGTVALELFEDVSDLDYLIVQVGGGRTCKRLCNSCPTAVSKN